MDVRRKMVRFRAWRRGFREMDLILGGFADARLESLSEADLSAFEALLQERDQDVYAWIIERELAPDALETPLLKEIRDFRPGAAEPRGVS